MIIDVSLSRFKIHDHSEYRLMPGINAIVGKGGCGKTSIMEAIGWTVFGAIPGKKSDFISMIEDVSPDGGSVELSAMVDYKLIEINKCLAGYASLYLNDRMIAEGEMAVRETIADLVGYKRMDVLFSGLIGITQGSLDGIFSRSTSERVKVFSKILGIDKYKLFSDWLLEFNHDLNVMTASAKAEHYFLVKDKAKADTVSVTRDDIVEQIKKTDAMIATRSEEASEASDKFEEYNTALKEVDVSQNEIDKLKALTPNWDSLSFDMDALTKNRQCPTCNQVINDRLTAGRLKLKMQDEFEKLLDAKEKIHLHNLAIFKNTELVSRLGRANYGGKLNLYNLSIQKLSDKRNVLRGKLEAMSASTDVDARIKEKEAELLGLRAAVSRLDVIRAAARKLPALIAVDTTQTVSELATEFVTLIYQNWSIAWNEDFSINVRIGEMSLSFAQLSKSQKSIAALSVVLALAKSVSPMDFILLDEPFANMDSEQVAAVAGAIRSTGWFEQVILTTHRAEVEHIFDNVIEVST